ncbi:MAG: endolytic transglycosylase MltG [Brumimicrobium sp.]
MKKYKLYRLLGVVLLCGLFSSCDSINAFFDANKESLNTVSTDFFVPTNTTIQELEESLFSNGIIDNKNALRNIIAYKEFDESKLGSGKYIIEPNTKYKDLINGFTINNLGNGNKEVEVNVTFNNCRDIYDIAGKVAQQIEMDSTAFLDYLLSDSILKKYGFTEPRIGALFLPNTYRFFWDTNHEDFITRMAQEFKRFWTADRITKLNHVGLKSQSDAVTLASIVYMEQNKKPEEWRTIAGLYLNRLKRGMKLESDPTFRHCWGRELDGVERLTYKHRDRDCPYNTYLYTGLPPGPIYIPPADVIDAVLNAEKNDYIFMCAKPGLSGLHNFSVTLSEHNRNARAFQSWLTEYQKNKNQ